MGASTSEGELAAILLRGERSILELLAAGAKLPQVLTSLCAVVEEVCTGALCSILLLTEDGLHLRHVAAPNLPPGYCRAIDGIAIGPAMGSCGTAAYTREPVIVSDIATDPLWRGYAALARTFGLASSASTPIFAGPDARLLGTFAIYHRTPGPYAALELSVLRSVSVLAAIAILSHEREEDLRESETRRARAAAASPVIEADVDLDGRWLRAPRALAGLLGRTEDEVLALRLRDVIHPSDLEADRSRYVRLFQGDLDSLETECRLLRKDGVPVWTALHAVTSRDADGKPRQVTLYVTDITLAKRTEETLRTSQKLEGLVMLAPGLAHDFNNLLTAILCNVSFAQAQVSRESVAGQSLEAIDAVARRAGDLTRQLALAGNGRAARKPIDVNQLAREITRTLSASLARGVRVELDLSPVVPSIAGDPSQIHQVAMNLILNAAQAIGDADGTIRLRTLAVDLREEDMQQRFAEERIAPGEYVLLEVSDTGSGISTDVMRRIFEPFFTTKPTGRGIGLAVSRGILREHRAGIEVESEAGRGSSFRLYLPVWRARGLRSSVRREEAPWPGAKGNVLVLDDDPVIRNSNVRCLADLGFEALESTSAQDALLQLAKRRSEISFVLFDLASLVSAGGGLSDGSSEPLAVLRERWPDLKVILTVGGEELEPDVLGEGVRVLAKPYSLLDLKRAISGDLDSSRRGIAPDEGASRSA
jgi:PAS domain S-box-containing protein